jgi:hypothetical protein
MISEARAQPAAGAGGSLKRHASPSCEVGDLPFDFLTFLERRLALSRESALAALADWLTHYEHEAERAFLCEGAELQPRVF